MLKTKQNVTPLEPSTIFRDIFNSDLGQYFVNKGEEVIALNMVGHLYNYVGNCILNCINRDNNKKIFYPLTKVTSINVLENGDFMVKCV